MAVLAVNLTTTGVLAFVLNLEDEVLQLQRWVWPLCIEAFKVKLKCSYIERISDYEHFVLLYKRSITEILEYKAVLT